VRINAKAARRKPEKRRRMQAPHESGRAGRGKEATVTADNEDERGRGEMHELHERMNIFHIPKRMSHAYLINHVSPERDVQHTKGSDLSRHESSRQVVAVFLVILLQHAVIGSGSITRISWRRYLRRVLQKYCGGRASRTDGWKDIDAASRGRRGYLNTNAGKMNEGERA
jgi:hypothetical protein